MPTITVQPVNISGSVVSNPVPDTVTVSPTRRHNPPQPLTVVPAPSFAGDAAGRGWGGTWFVECLTGPGQGLRRGVPTIYEDAATPGLLSVSHVYLHEGSTSEVVTPRVRTRNQHEGERGDNLVHPFCTLIPTPRTNPADPTLWTGIDLSGWLFHVTATGKVISAGGPSLPGTVFPTAGGARKTTLGSFPDGPLNGPNDLCFDPKIPTILYIADTFNHRICKLVETSPGVIVVRTYYMGGLRDPYSLYAEPDGTLIVADRGNNRIIAIPQLGGPGPGATAGPPVTIASGLGLPMVVRPFSDGNICCAEHGGTRRLLEVTRATGALRTIELIRTLQGSQDVTWLWMDVDDHGTCGPVDDIGTIQLGSYQTLKRTSRDGTYKSFVNRGSRLQQGKLSLVTDPQGHYPWAFAFSDTEAKMVFTGGGSTQIRQWRRLHINDVTTVDDGRYSRGANVWQSTGDTTIPSIWLISGHAGGHNFLGLHNTETLDAMSWDAFAAWLRGGGNGSVPRLLTDAQVQDARYYVKRNARRGLRDGTVDAIGHLAPPSIEDPGPAPPDPTVTRLVAASIEVTVEEIIEDNPDTPPIPDPPLPPPGGGDGSDIDPGVWRQLVVPTSTIYQPRLSGSQSIAEGQPGAAQSIAPNPVSATGRIFRSFSGLVAGKGNAWYIGGGHAGHPGNDVDILDLNTGTWTLPFEAECPAPYLAGGAPNPLWNALKGGGVGLGGLSPTGRPWCNHSYRGMAVDTTRDRLLWLSGNGLGAFAQDGTWTQLAGRDKTKNEPGGYSNLGILYDPERDSVWAFIGDTNNGLARGIYEYSMATDAWRRVMPWQTVAGWSFGSKYILAYYVPQMREAFLLCMAQTSVPEFPNRLFRYGLDTGTLTWEQTLLPGMLHYEELRGAQGVWNTKADFRRATNQLYCYTSAFSGTAWGSAEAGFWIFSPAPGSGGTWHKFLTPNGPALARYTLAYDETTDQFIGMRARSVYCGIAGAACGGIADTHLFTFS